MKVTLLLRLAAPLQAWGGQSKFDIRRTEREPTKSGVIGLLAAALGRPRDADLEDLNALRFGVRVDQEGKLLRDLHTARKDDKTSYLTNRYYLSDAIFLVGLEGEEEFLEELEQALRRPAYPLFLGRRSCPPTLPLLLGIRTGELEQALRMEPPQAATWRRKQDSMRMVVDALPGEGAGLQRDKPISFNPAHRAYAHRAVKALKPAQMALGQTEHDPMTEL